MLDFSELREFCRPLIPGTCFYRPFLSRRYHSDNDNTIWIVGTNPATSIKEEDVTLDEYVTKLQDYDAFDSLYRNLRKKKNKPAISPTRRGISALGDWIISNTSANVIETNVNAYPSSREEELKHGNVPDIVIKRGKDIFAHLLVQFRPQLLVVHGTTHTVPELKKIIKGCPQLTVENLQLGIFEFEGIRYPDNRVSVILTCPHLRFYGHSDKREAFETLIHEIDAILYKPPAVRNHSELLPLPERHEKIQFDLTLTKNEFRRLRYGFYPDDDTRWFIYLEDNQLYFHRSWTRYCVFQLRFEETANSYQVVEALVNRDPEQYKCKNPIEDQNLLFDLLNWLFGIERHRG